MRKQLTPPFGTLPNQNPKQGAQGSISHLGLAIRSGVKNYAKLEISTSILHKVC